MRTCKMNHVAVSDTSEVRLLFSFTLSGDKLSLSGLCLKNKVPDNVFFRVAKSLVPCIWVYIYAWGTSPPSHHLVQVEPVSENVLFCFQEPSLRWHYSHAKQTQQHLGHPSTAGATWHNHSGLNSHTLLLNKLSLTHTQTHKVPHRQEISRVSTVMSSHTTHTFIALHPCSHLDLSSLRDRISCCSLAPPAPSPLPSPLPPTWAQWVVWRQVLVVGFVTTGPDNQRVCKCQCVWFSNLCLMVRVSKGRYFYGNCRWSILLYIYVINMWLNRHLTGSFWLFGSPASCVMCWRDFH